MNYKTILICSLLFFFSNIDLFSQSTSPVHYMNRLITPFSDLDSKKWQYVKAITRGKSAKKVESKRKALIDEYGSVIAQIGRVRTYKQDSLLRPAVMGYLKLTKQVLREDYGEIVDLEKIADESFDGMEAYLTAQEKANEKLNEASLAVNEAYDQYAALNDVTINEGSTSKLRKKIEKGAQALSYYNKNYLIFFKAFHQERYVFDAISRGDISSLEQSANGLSSTAAEGIENLNDVENYNGDASLKTATKNVLSFMKKQGENDYPQMTDFLLMQDEIDSAGKKLEAKKQKDRTKKEIDSYNNMLKKYNAGIKDFNKNLDKLNKDRSDAIKSYEDAIAAFFDKHT